MQKIIEKAEVLIEALPYIQAFRDAIIVVKFGGSAMEDPVHMDRILTDIAFMECAGMHPVVVHGGGKAISRGLKASGLESRFVRGLRVTCEKTIAIVERVIRGEINPQLVKILTAKGARAHGVYGEDVFRVTRKTETDAVTGEKLDWGFVGEPSSEVDTTVIRALVQQDVIPVITPLGRGPDDRVHNVNADTAAAALAKELKARKLVFLTDVPGLLSNPEDPASVIPTLKISEVAKLTEKGIIGGGMLPKIASCVEALNAGVRKIHLVDGRMPHSLLLEIFTKQGVGTEIVNDEHEA